MRDGRLLIADDLTSPHCALVRLHRRVGTQRLISRDALDDWAQRIQRMAASADGPDAYFSSGPRGDDFATGSAVAPAVYSAIPQRPHEADFVRLAGPIYFLVGTDFEDQPILNLRALEGRVSELALALSSAPATAARARAEVPDWRRHAREFYDARGLKAFFKKAPVSSPEPPAGEKRPLEDEQGAEAAAAAEAPAPASASASASSADADADIVEFVGESSGGSSSSAARRSAAAKKAAGSGTLLSFFSAAKR